LVVDSGPATDSVKVARAAETAFARPVEPAWTEMVTVVGLAAAEKVVALVETPMKHVRLGPPEWPPRNRV